MTPAELAAELRTRINPIYASQLGTESYERRLCAEAIEGLIAELAQCKNELTAATIRIENDAWEFVALKSQEPIEFQFQDKDGKWYPFLDQRHYDNTVADGRWPIRSLFLAAGAQKRKPEECANGCPERQVCDYCQGTGGKDKQERKIRTEFTPAEKAVLGPPHPNDFGIPKEYWEKAQYYADYWKSVKAQERKPLTDEQIDDCMMLPVGCEGWTSIERSRFMARAIEAKIKEQP